jgi:hypothetical protein
LPKKSAKTSGGKTSETGYCRRTFMFDEATDKEVEIIRQAIRGTTASAAVRYAVRKVADLMRHVRAGGSIYVDSKGKKSTLVVDIPSA